MMALLRRVLGRSTPNPLHVAVRSTMPEMGEAEMDRYRAYHTSNQHGR